MLSSSTSGEIGLLCSQLMDLRRFSVGPLMAGRSKNTKRDQGHRMNYGVETTTIASVFFRTL
jgi:hypothetical protein